MNRGYYYTITTAGSGTIAATWTLPSRNNIRLNIYAGNPFAGQPNPAALPPPGGSLASNSGNVTVLTATTGVTGPGTYSIYFYNQGSAIGSSTATVTYVKAPCP